MNNVRERIWKEAVTGVHYPGFSLGVGGEVEENHKKLIDSRCPS